MIHNGNLTITEENAAQYANLTSVGGGLEVRADFSAPNLTSVGGGLEVRADFSAPNLTSVGRWLEVRADFSAPNLTSVGWGLDVNAEFSAPNLTSVGWGLDVNAEFSAPNLTSVEGEDTLTVNYVLGKRYPVLITDKYMRIGCQRHLKLCWTEFSDAQINCMDTGALEFWRDNKAELLGLCGL